MGNQNDKPKRADIADEVAVDAVEQDKKPQTKRLDNQTKERAAFAREGIRKASE